MASRKKRPQKEVQRSYVVAGISLVVVVLAVLVIMFAPREEAVVGQAIADDLGCELPPEQMIAWWPGDGDFVDVMGGDEGVPHGDPTFSAGKSGQAFSFDGVDDWIEFGDFPLPESFTIAMWVNGRSRDDAAYLSKTDDSGDNTNVFIIGQYDSDYHYRICGGELADCFISTEAEVIGLNHIILTGQPENGKYKIVIYRNGVLYKSKLVNNRPAALVPTGRGWILGQEFDSSFSVSDLFEGYIDDVMFFSAAMNDELPSNLYNLLNEGGEICKCGQGNVFSTSEGNLLCDGEKFVECEEDGSIEGAFVCQDNRWSECSEGNLGVSKGDFTCVQIGDNLQWTDTCSEEIKYTRRKSNTEMCNGRAWVTCEEAAGEGVEQPANPNINPIVPRCEGGTFPVIEEYNCNNDFDDDNDGKEDGEDSDCQGKIEYTFGNDVNQIFQLKLTTADSFSADIFGEDGEHLAEISACDVGTGGSANEVTLCTGQDGIIIKSNTLLSNVNERPRYEPDSKLTILFEEDDPKEVSIIYTMDITEGPSEVWRFLLTSNLLGGQRLVIKQGDEFYLLSYPDNPQFRLSDLQLMHIPLGVNDQRYEYQAEEVPGANQVVFHVLNNQNIIVGFDSEGRFIVSSDELVERAPGYVVPRDLSQEYETTFTHDTPLQIDNYGLGVISFCQTGDYADNERDTQQASICRDADGDGPLPSEHWYSLQLDVLESVNVDLLDPDDITLIYQLEDGQKQVSIFDLKIPEIEPDQALFPRELLQYNNFIDKLLDGQRISIEFENKQYLLSHERDDGVDIFSLPKLVLRSYEEEGTNDYKAEGSEGKVEFLPPEGRIFIKRQYGTPPPPFQMWAKNLEQLTPFVIGRDLSTSFSSVQAVQMEDPNFGSVGVDDSDTALYQPTFNVNLVGESHTLTFGEPKPIRMVNGDKIENLLMYYNSAEIDGVTPIKTANVYHYFDLDRTKSRLFDNDFLLEFSGGGIFALYFEDNYYLLGHEGNEGERQFYNPALLTLTTIDGTETFEVQVEAGIATFEVSGGRIQIRVDIDNNLMYLEPATGSDLLETKEFAALAAELTTSNRIEVGNNIILRQCYKEAYADFPAAKVCGIPGYGQRGLVVNPAEIVTIGRQQFLLETNEETGDEKIVTIRYLIDMSRDQPIDDWYKFAREVQELKYPVFNISGKIYFPVADSTRLEDFGLAEYPDGRETLADVNFITDISYNGTISLGKDVIFINQAETEDENVPVTALFTHYSQQYAAPGETIELIGLDGEAIKFSTTPSTRSYTLRIEETLNDLVQLQLNGVFNKLFAVGDTRTLTLDGVRIHITLEEITLDDRDRVEEVKVTITR